MQKWNGSLLRKFDDAIDGNASVGTTVVIRNTSDNSLAVIYDVDDSNSVQKNNPFVTDDFGRYSFYAPNGKYTIEFGDGSDSIDITLVDNLELQGLLGLTDPSDLAQRHRIKTTVAEIATGVFKDGDRLEVTDRNRGHYIIESGTANTYDKIAAGAGMIARYQLANGWVLAKQVGFVAVDTGVPTVINDAAWNAIVNNSTYKQIAFEDGRYGFESISFDRQVPELYLGNAIFMGITTAPKRSLLAIRQGNTSRIIGGKLSGVQNLNYTCGVHWYTNDLNTYFPGKLTWHDTVIGEFLLGLNVGMLASQTTYYAQGTVQAEGVATDAPLSECDVSGLKIVDCPSAFRIAQPNGKLLISDSYIASEGLGWATQTAKETWKAVTLQGWGEVQFVSSSIEAIHAKEGSLFEMFRGHITVNSCVVEAQSPNRLAGSCVLRMSQLGNYGFNSNDKPCTLVKSDSTGYMTLDNTWLVFNHGNMEGGTAILAKGVSNLSTASYAEAPNFLITCSNVELRDVGEKTSGAWRMASQGVKTKYSNVTLTSNVIVDAEYSVINRTINAKVNNSTKNLLSDLVDNSNVQIATYPQASTSTSGGWVFATAGGAINWGSQTPSAGLNVGTLNGAAQVPSKVLRMNAAGSMTATSPALGCEPLSYVYVTGWINVLANPGGVVGVKMQCLNFNGSLVTTKNMTIGSGTALASGWQPFTCWAQQPNNCSKVSIQLYTESTIDIEWFGISAYVDK